MADSAFFIYAVLLFAIVMGGLYIVTGVKTEKRVELMQKIVIDNNVNEKALVIANKAVADLPPNPNIRFFVSLIIIKAFAFLQVAPILLFAIFIAIIDVSIKKGSPFYSYVPSMTTYHDAKRMFPAFLVHMPLAYIVMPVESFLEFNAQSVKFALAITNGFLLYQRLKDLMENKPKLM